MSDAPLGVALVGCGAVARLQRARIYPRVAALGRVVATCDHDLERARTLAAMIEAATGEAPTACASLDEALADPRVHAVDICTPHPSHAEVALRVIAAGKHVLVEKPIATTLDDGRRMVAAARQAGVTLAVNEQVRFMEPVLRARAMLASGDLGRVAVVRAHRVGYLSGDYMASGWRRDPSLAGGGMLLDQGPHYFHLLRLLAGAVAGEITHVAALCATMRHDWQPGAEDTAVVIVRYASGLLGEALFCWATRTPDLGAWAYAYGAEGSLEIFSRQAGLIWHRHPPRAEHTAGSAGAPPAGVAQRTPASAGPEVVLPARPIDDALEACLADFLRAARGESAPQMPGEEGLRDLAVVEAAYRSIQTGQLEQVQELT
jgi:UDP-N-acetyl-2-amino-2-deoxyglucuronate dehydrogenase